MFVNETEDTAKELYRVLRVIFTQSLAADSIVTLGQRETYICSCFL